MEKSTAKLLLAGARIDRRRFADDIARLYHKETPPPLPPAAAAVEVLPTSPALRKRKRKEKSRRKRNKTSSNHGSDVVEGFNVFAGSEYSVDAAEQPAEAGASDRGEDTMQRKELERRIERAAKLRNRFGIHISKLNVPAPLESFEELAVRFKCKRYLLKNLADLGFKEPTPIQRQAIPILLSERECLACAPTGSGKTVAFLVPVLMKIKPQHNEGIKAIIMCPTRELAAQTKRECKKLIRGSKFIVKLMTKRLSMKKSFAKLRCHILVSTPLRLDHALREGGLDLSRIEYLVLDEADKLFELGFFEQIDAIVNACSNPSVIRSLFSATLPDVVEERASSIMHDAVRVIIGRRNSANESIKQKLIFTGTERGKLLALRQCFAESLNPPVLVFVQSKERAKELYKELMHDDVRADVIHGDLTEQEREEAVYKFRAGKKWVLIATDIISRGMDFKGVNCVINYDFPESAAAYIHRIGRTGRAGRAGVAITLFTEEDKSFLRNIANVMIASGCEVPSWILALPKLKGKKHHPSREPVPVMTV